MKTNKLYIVVGLIIAFSLFSKLAAHADESDQATTITFNQSIQIPGRSCRWDVPFQAGEQ